MKKSMSLGKHMFKGEERFIAERKVEDALRADTSSQERESARAVFMRDTNLDAKVM